MRNLFIFILLFSTTLCLANSDDKSSNSADFFNEVKNFKKSEQEEENWCWAAVSQMALNFQSNKEWKQCEVVSKYLNQDCCDKNSNSYSDKCLEPQQLEEVLSFFKKNLKHIDQSNSNRWPIDPEEVIKQLKNGNPVIMRMYRGEGKGNHVNTALGYGKEDGERYIYIFDSVLGDLYIYESSWDRFFPNIDKDMDQLQVPLYYRAWTIN